MSPPSHISYSLLLPTRGLYVNELSKPSEPYHYQRSPCAHLAKPSDRSTRRINTQNNNYTGLHVVETLKNYNITTGQHVTTLPYLFLIYFTTTLDQNVIKTQNQSNTTFNKVNKVIKALESYNFIITTF